MMDNLGDYMPGWEIEELIGRGAYGKVYRIKKVEFGYAYYSALKVIRIPSDETESYSLSSMGMNKAALKTYYEETAREICNEIRIMESLKSANNIVHVEEHALISNEDQLGWTILIRMELLESIRHYQLRMGLPDLYEVIKIGKDLCAALECCEGKNIVHRDVKPDNVFRNEFGMYKLGDFGIARKLEKTKAAYSKKGTMTYIAPEVVKGNVYDNTVDIYSLGLMLYIYLNRQKPPFVDADIQNITSSMLEEAQWRRINGEMLPAPAEAPATLASIILKACHPNPQQRYGSAGDFRRALENWERANLQNENRRTDTVVLNAESFDQSQAGGSNDTVVLDSDTMDNNHNDSKSQTDGGRVYGEQRLQSPKVNKNKYVVLLSALVPVILLAGGLFFAFIRNEMHSQTAAESADAGTEKQTVMIDSYYGLDVETARTNMGENVQYRVERDFTDKDVEFGKIFAQYPAHGTEIRTADEGVCFYISRGNLTNNSGYYLQSDTYSIQLTKGEKKTITLTILPVGSVGGAIHVAAIDGLEITWHGWKNGSIKADIECLDDFYKGGIIQFYFLDDQNSSSGSYCNVYYTIE